MKITRLTIRRFRAFDQEVSFPLSDLSVLTGPNNLGKSTVLSALGLLFSLRSSSHDRVYMPRTAYDFATDYPKQHQEGLGELVPTCISVRLKLSETEADSASGMFAHPFGEDSELSVQFPMNGERLSPTPVYSFNGQIMRSTQGAQLAKWLSDHIRYVYIPATRNFDDFRRAIFGELVQAAIQGISQSQRRVNALADFYNDVRSEMDEVAQTLGVELQQFLPTIASIRFSIDDLALEQLINIRDVEVDDGTLTSLKQKGDGFKSLFVISMLQYIARQRFGRSLVFGVEEPEAHLHPSAVYEVKKTLRHLSETFQTIITTHSPILIERDCLGRNIIIRPAADGGPASEARLAGRLADIRESLGIRPHDNMTTADVIVVVEGISEERSLPALIAASTPSLRPAMNEGRVRVLSANGAANVPAVIRALARDVANVIVFLDSDEAGENAASRISNEGLVGEADIYRVPKRKGCSETEFEDLFDPELYLGAVSTICGIAVLPNDFLACQRKSGGKANRMKKWSDVMDEIMNMNGKEWKLLEARAKTAVAESLSQKADTINKSSLVWLQSICSRVSSYLMEG